MAATHLVDGVSRLATNTLEVVVQRSSSSSSSSTRFDAGEVQAVGGELGDAPQPVDVALAVAAVAADRAGRVEQALALVDAQRLRMHAGELGGDRDHVDASCSRFSSHLTPPDGHAATRRVAFASSSIALRSLALEPRRHGDLERHEQVARRLAVRHAAGPSLAAASSSGTDGLIFSFTGPPSSVGTSTCAPSAASGYVTGTREREVEALAAEDLVRQHLRRDVEVAGRPAVAARAAATLQADALPVVDARRDAHLHLALAPLDAGAATGRARVFDHMAEPAAVAARRAQREQALVVVEHAPALARPGRSSRACPDARRCRCTSSTPRRS